MKMSVEKPEKNEYPRASSMKISYVIFNCSDGILNKIIFISY